MTRSSTIALALVAGGVALALARCALGGAERGAAPALAEERVADAPHAAEVALEPAAPARREEVEQQAELPSLPFRRAGPPPPDEPRSVPAEPPPSLLASALAGVVVDSAGVALPDAAVFVASAGVDVDPRSARATARTDAAGRFRVDGPPAGAIRVAASSAERPPCAWIELLLAEGAAREDLRIVLARGGRVEGSLDPSLGIVEGRSVVLSTHGAAVSREAEVDAAGRFVLEDVTPHEYELELFRPATAPRDPSLGLAARFELSFPEVELRRRVAVEEGRTTRVVLGAARSILVRGKLRLRGSAALLPGAKVQAFPQGENEERDGSQTVSGYDGSYALRVAGAGGYAFAIIPNENSHRFYQRTVPDGDELELDFELPGGAISGRVLDAEGRPVPGAPVSLLGEGAPEDFYGERFRRAFADDLGRFEFLLLAPNTYALRAPDGFQDYRPPPRFAHGRVRLDGLVLAEGAALEGIELVLPAEGRIAGEIVDALGAVVAGARVRVLDARGVPLSAFREAESDAAGRFEVLNVAAGTYTVVARAGEREAKSPPVAVSEGATASARVELR